MITHGRRNAQNGRENGFERAAEFATCEDLRRTTKTTRRLHATVCRVRSIHGEVQALADALQLEAARVMECSISRIFPRRMCRLKGCFRDGVPDKNCYRRYRIRTVEGQAICEHGRIVSDGIAVLLEAREINPEAAEFSQEIRAKRWSG